MTASSPSAPPPPRPRPICRSALTGALGTLANTDLKAASAVQASNEFFDADASNPPLRVDGPPFDTATSLVAGTSANTVIWYTGEAGGGAARSSATARIDPSLVVNYGTRANETGIRNLVQNVATLAAVTVSASDPNGANLAAALDQRLSANIDGSGGAQTVTDIQADLAGVQTSLKTVKSNHAADQQHAGGVPAAGRGRLQRGGRQPDTGAADAHAGHDADHGPDVQDQPGQLPVKVVHAWRKKMPRPEPRHDAVWRCWRISRRGCCAIRPPARG